MLALRDLIAETHISQTFWVLNPNSGDTGGLLLDDWKTWDEAKYAMLKPALWQYNGKFVGLDHQVKLGANGMSLADRYGGTVNPTDSASPSVSPSASKSSSPSPSPSAFRRRPGRSGCSTRTTARRPTTRRSSRACRSSTPGPRRWP
ncbi:hypothetical protein GCM10010170_083270 [Dactylosporangium salmoneum]|uniref:GH26 domain-containing protein n=1 Tax=Dactylosporangium salmoneum TaxID=53361 RepID=A0ABN3HEQ5_9ACTN